MSITYPVVQHPSPNHNARPCAVDCIVLQRILDAVCDARSPKPSACTEKPVTAP